MATCMTNFEVKVEVADRTKNIESFRLQSEMKVSMLGPDGTDVEQV